MHNSTHQEKQSLLTRHINVACRISESLFDLQLVTALAILTAALPQLRATSIYHQDLAMSYFTVTLASFASITLMKSVLASIGVREKPLHVKMRFLLVFANLVLGITYMILSTTQEAELIKITNFCVAYPPGVSLEVNLADEVIETILIASLTARTFLNMTDCLAIPPLQKLFARYRAFLERIHRKTASWTALPHEHWTHLTIDRDRRGHTFIQDRLRDISLVIVGVLRFILCATFLQLVPWWYSTNGLMLCENIASFMVLIIETWYVATLRTASREYMDGNEDGMGFGQVLPLTMLLLLVLGMFTDAPSVTQPMDQPHETEYLGQVKSFGRSHSW